MKTLNIDIKVNILGSEWTVRSATEAEEATSGRTGEGEDDQLHY